MGIRAQGGGVKSSLRHTLGVMPGLDPGIHDESQQSVASRKSVGV
jgi:hypothetical protein